MVSNDGHFEAACRYLDASAMEINVPLGLGSRHVAAASITRLTDAVAIVVATTRHGADLLPWKPGGRNRAGIVDA